MDNINEHLENGNNIKMPKLGAFITGIIGLSAEAGVSFCLFVIAAISASNHVATNLGSVIAYTLIAFLLSIVLMVIWWRAQRWILQKKLGVRVIGAACCWGIALLLLYGNLIALMN